MMMTQQQMLEWTKEMSQLHNRLIDHFKSIDIASLPDGHRERENANRAMAAEMFLRTAVQFYTTISGRSVGLAALKRDAERLA